VTRKKYPREWTKETILEIFRDLDRHFKEKNRPVEILTIGGVPIVLQGFQNRSTNDIDLAPVRDSELFLKACHEAGIPGQIVTLCSTVDFNDVDAMLIFRGSFLKVFSVSPGDLIKLKLERFRKQDPEDIYSIMQKTGVTFEQFFQWVKEGRSYYIGRESEYLLSARIVVERMFPERLSDFKVVFPPP